jgi:hypothetical protein
VNFGQSISEQQQERLSEYQRLRDLLGGMNQFTDILHAACVSDTNSTEETSLHFGNF